jgi:Transposase DDE domain
LEALEVEALYKNRWQVELFFRWIKQNLQMKTIWSCSENTVKIYIWVAVCTYLIVVYLKYQLRSPYSIYEMMQILGISVLAKTLINELLTKTQINQSVKEQLNYFIFNEI